ncbi:hypothetical protein GOBAR_DD20777 [Gossypium barbadense]|nr:hypothetical protein GOBAR_DD20777 [Gossypium barbadense]
MLLRSGRKTSKDLVNITDRQAGHSNRHVEPNISEDSNMANQTLKQLAAPNLAAQPPSITRSDLGKRMDEGQSSMMEAQVANLTSMEQPNHQNLSAETKTHTMLEQMMKMMADQKKETDGRFQFLESVINDEEDDTEVKKVRFSDIEEENLALPKADLQPSQTAPKEARKSRLQQPTASHDTANIE